MKQEPKMKLSGSLALLALGATATTTDFSKEKAGIDAIAKQAKANLLERIDEQCDKPRYAGPKGPKGPGGIGGPKGHAGPGCTADKLVYRKE